MTAPVLARRGAGARGVAQAIYGRWSGERPARFARALVLCACVLLFLHAAATVEVVYTLRVSYLLLAAACAVGLPFVIRGWMSLPATWRWAAGMVAAIHLLAAALGEEQTVAQQERGGGHRDLVYMFDLLLGLSAAGLLCGLFREPGWARRALGALLAGGLLAALYGIVQWPARHYDWSIANVNNALNPDAVTRGEVPQGSGVLLGWERVRGTFTEPLFFGLYLASIFPLVAVWFGPGRRRRGLCAAAAVVLAFTLVLVSSFPSWVICAGACLVALVIFAVSRGSAIPAALAAGALAAGGVGAVALLASPETLSAVTGRDAGDLVHTTASRTDAWTEATQTWMQRPVLGHGPGQSSVALARPQTNVSLDGSPGPVVLGSAQGLLFAALIDVGLLGVLAWIAFIAACLGPVLGGLARGPSTVRLGITAAALAAVSGAFVSGDRFEMQAWVVLGLALAVTSPDFAKRRRVSPSGRRLAVLAVAGMVLLGASGGALAGLDKRAPGHNAEVLLALDPAWDGLDADRERMVARLTFLQRLAMTPEVLLAAGRSTEFNSAEVVDERTDVVLDVSSVAVRVRAHESDAATAQNIAANLAHQTLVHAERAMRSDRPGLETLGDFEDGRGPWRGLSAVGDAADVTDGTARRGSRLLRVSCPRRPGCGAAASQNGPFEAREPHRFVVWGRANDGEVTLRLAVHAPAPVVFGSPVTLRSGWQRITVDWEPERFVKAVDLVVERVGGRTRTSFDIDAATYEPPRPFAAPDLPRPLQRAEELRAFAAGEYASTTAPVTTGVTGRPPVATTLAGTGGGLLVGLFGVAGAVLARRRAGGSS